MSRGDKTMLLPRLRFPEFLGEGEWSMELLGNICSNISSGKDKSDINGSYDLYGSTGVIGKTLSNTFAGDFILAARVGANAGLLTRASGKFGVTDNTLVIFLKKTEKIDFIYYSLSNLRLNKMVFGSGQPLITGKQLKELGINLPTLKEQQKIADCLSSIDELITAHTQKHEALKAHKKGLMQQLFPAEGETVPKLRFPEFRDAGEWNISTIEGVGSISSGGTPSRTKNEYWNGNIPWVTTTLINFNIISIANETITKIGLQNSSTKILPKNTILMAMYGQGKTRGKVAILGIDAAINQACAAIILKKEVDTGFVFQNLASRYDEIRKISNQGGQKNLSGTLIKKIPFLYPNTNEQQKIANCLSSLDKLITTQIQKIESLKSHKKGLMQQLFPATDGANG